MQCYIKEYMSVRNRLGVKLATPFKWAVATHIPWLVIALIIVRPR